jgi:hypothetical protein
MTSPGQTILTAAENFLSRAPRTVDHQLPAMASMPGARAVGKPEFRANCSSTCSGL